MTCAVMLACGALALWDEPPVPAGGPHASATAPGPGDPLPPIDAPGERAQVTLRSVLATLRRALATRESAWFLAFLLTYRIGESCVDAMWKPYLVDQGFTPEQILSWVSTWGVAAGLLGSLAGGVLVGRAGLWRALALTGVVRCAPLVAEALVASLDHPRVDLVVGVTVLEHFTSGLLTTATFAFMMSRVDRTIGASHYTLLASVEVLGKSPGVWASGFLARDLGYTALFFGGTALSLAPLVLLLPLRDPTRDAPPRAA